MSKGSKNKAKKKADCVANDSFGEAFGHIEPPVPDIVNNDEEYFLLGMIQLQYMMVISIMLRWKSW